MINKLNSSIKKQISARAATLAYSGYFLGHPQPHLTEAREAKIAEEDLAAGSIEVIFAGDTSVSEVFTEVAFAGDTYIGIRLSGTGTWLLIK